MPIALARRQIVLGGLAAAGLISAPAFAASIEEREAAFFRHALVINGNLVPPLDDKNRLPEEVVAEFRASGLSALKVSMGGSGSSYADTVEELAAYDRAIALMPDLLMQVRSVADIDLCKRTNRIGIIYSFESVEMHEGRPERVAEFANRGVKVMQLSYNLPSQWASGVMSPAPSHGLTDLGRQAVASMNLNRVAIDIAHADDKSSLDIMAASRRPVSITHAGCKAVHDNPRNKTDAVLKRLADQGGVVGIFELSFLNGGVRQPTIEDYMAHMTHALRVAGEDHVGIGSDAILTAFDTSPETLEAWAAETKRRKDAGIAAPGEGPPPFVEGLNRSDRAAVIAHELRKRGYRDRTIEKVLGLNFRRWFRETWA